VGGASAAHTSSLRSLQVHSHGSILALPGRLWVSYQETWADVPAEKGIAMGARRKWVGTIVIAAVLLLSSAVPGHTGRGGDGYRRHGHEGHGHKGHGYRGHGHRHHGHRHHGHRGPRVFISPRLVVPFGPYWELYGYPPVVVAPSPRVYVEALPPVAAQPPPPSYWYYCDASQAYYPYVQQCPGGWRAVAPTPP
jgi:hypothetical protein